VTRSLITAAAAAALAVAAACDDGAPLAREEAAIRAAIDGYLREQRGINPDAMQMDLAELSLREDRAQAVVRFSSPQVETPLEFEYSLERDAGGWKVVGSRARGAGHAAGDLPEGHPPVPTPDRSGATSPAQPGT
jgi:hypothetical protein